MASKPSGHCRMLVLFQSSNTLTSACALIGPVHQRVIDVRAVVPQFSRATEAHVTMANRPRAAPSDGGRLPRSLPRGACAKPPRTYDPGLMTSCIS
jgi:hypothetical protein